MNVMTEITSIKLPVLVEDLPTILLILDDIISIAYIYKYYCTKQNNGNSSFVHSTLP